jgi:hypothetical protein
MSRSANGRSAVCERASWRSPPSAPPGPLNLIARFQALDAQDTTTRSEPRRFARSRRARTTPRSRCRKISRFALPVVIPPRYEGTHLLDLRSTGPCSHPRPPLLAPRLPPKRLPAALLPDPCTESRPHNPRRPPSSHLPPRSQAATSPHEPVNRPFPERPSRIAGYPKLTATSSAPTSCPPPRRLAYDQVLGYPHNPLRARGRERCQWLIPIMLIIQLTITVCI